MRNLRYTLLDPYTQPQQQFHSLCVQVQNRVKRIKIIFVVALDDDDDTKGTQKSVKKKIFFNSIVLCLWLYRFLSQLTGSGRREFLVLAGDQSIEAKTKCDRAKCVFVFQMYVEGKK